MAVKTIILKRRKSDVFWTRSVKKGNKVSILTISGLSIIVPGHGHKWNRSMNFTIVGDHLARGGGTDLERGYGDVRPWRPPFHASPAARKGPISSERVSSQDPFWENLEILASAASIFTQILAHKPLNLEIFSSQAPKFGNFPLTSPPFQRQMSVRKPHTSEIRAAHPYLKKKLSAPPPPGHLDIQHGHLRLASNANGKKTQYSWISLESQVSVGQMECYFPQVFLVSQIWYLVFTC